MELATDINNDQPGVNWHMTINDARRKLKKQTNTYPLRLPASLKAAVAEISREDGTSMNQFIATAIAEKISAMKAAEFFATRRAGADVEAARRLLRRDGGQPPEPEDLPSRLPSP